MPWYARLVRRRRRFKDRFWRQFNPDGAQNDGWPEKTGNCGRNPGGVINRACPGSFSFPGRGMLSFGMFESTQRKARREKRIRENKADEPRVLTIRTKHKALINVTIVNYSITTAVVR